MTDDTVFTAKGIGKSFRGKRVLAELDLALARGEVTVLVGRNGAGKSTLLRLALGALRADRGTLRVVGKDPARKTTAVRQRVGYVPDVPDAYPWMKPVELYRFLAPHYPSWDAAYADELARSLDVPMQTRLGEQSRGQGMKVMLVAALAFRPELLLLDEPFAGLDPVVRDEVLHGVLASLREQNVTVLCATHDLEVATRLADRIAVLENGRIARNEPLDAFFAEGRAASEEIKSVLVAARDEEETPCAR